MMVSCHLQPTKSIGQRINTSLAVQFYCFLTSNPRTTNIIDIYITLKIDVPNWNKIEGIGYSEPTLTFRKDDYTGKTTTAFLPATQEPLISLIFTSAVNF